MAAILGLEREVLSFLEREKSWIVEFTGRLTHFDKNTFPL